VAPEPVRNADFTRAVARAVRRPALLPAPAFAVRLALRELSGELLGSRRVLPARAQALGHPFAFPQLASALAAELA
jgi:NAD dependent epimerase/dehydratase family enzyme